MASRCRMLVVAALALAVLQCLPGAASPALSPFYCLPAGGNTTTIGACLNDTLPYVAIGLLLSFQVVAIAYLLGEVLNMAPLKGWYINELWESGKSVALVGVIFGVMMLAGAASSYINGNYSFSGATGSLCGSTVATTSTTANLSDIYVTACNYLSQESLVANASYFNLLGVVMANSYLQSIKVTNFYVPLVDQIPLFVPLPPFPIFGSINFASGFQFFQSQTFQYSGGGGILGDTLNYLVFPMLLVTNLQYYLLFTLMSIGLGLFLPIGLILRAIPFLRPLGAMFIAVAIGVSLIYPMTLVLFNYPMTTYFEPTYSSLQGSIGGGQAACTATISAILACTMLAPVLAITSVTQGIFTALMGTANPLVASAFNSGFNTGINTFYPTGTLMPALSSLYAFTVLPLLIQFVLFVVDLITIVAITSNVASALGGKLTLGVGKMKLT